MGHPQLRRLGADPGAPSRILAGGGAPGTLDKGTLQWHPKCSAIGVPIHPSPTHVITEDPMTTDPRPDDKNYKRPDFSNVQSGSSSTAPSTQGESRTYVVAKGDSLSKIAQHFYGDANQWRRIFEANREHIKDPDLIHPGQTLRIP